jgi:hypothetical protein
VDALKERFRRGTGPRTDCARGKTRERSTVVWIRWDHPDYGLVPVQTDSRPQPVQPPFRAQLINASGMSVPLKSVANLQHYRDKFVVIGWGIAQSLEDHKGSTIRIEALNGEEAALLMVR